jgi:predicted unusual protein kinase regulating ubiquinone biosynthesis (AarF/ABC1/UbiB family)
VNLHNKYCDYVFNVVLHQRGVYIKLGQIASTRPDIIPKPYLKKFAQLQVKTKTLFLYSFLVKLGRCTCPTG